MEFGLHTQRTRTNGFLNLYYYWFANGYCQEFSRGDHLDDFLNYVIVNVLLHKLEYFCSVLCHYSALSGKYLLDTCVNYMPKQLINSNCIIKSSNLHWILISFYLQFYYNVKSHHWKGILISIMLQNGTWYIASILTYSFNVTSTYASLCFFSIIYERTGF